MAIDFKQIVGQAFREYEELLGRRDEVDLEIAKLNQFLMASLKMLPESDRESLEREFAERVVPPRVGLTQAIRSLLKGPPNKWHTAPAVRDELLRSGFDFTTYKANPLASIHTILKRLTADDVESTTIDGATAYKWMGKSPSLVDMAQPTGKLGSLKDLLVSQKLRDAK